MRRGILKLNFLQTILRLLVMLFLWGSISNCAQQIQQEWLEMAYEFLRSRATTAIALGGSEIMLDGQYEWDIRNAEVSIFKIPWRIDLNELDPKPIGSTGLKWSLVWEGAGGTLWGEDRFGGSWLTGNKAEFSTIAVGTGLGPRIYISSQISMLVTAGMIYGYVSEHFLPLTETGHQAVEGIPLDKLKWHAHELVFSPGAELRYKKWFNKIKFQYSLRYVFYYALRVGGSSHVRTLESDAAILKNEIEFEVQTPLKVRQIPVHWAVNFSRAELYGDLKSGLISDYMYSTGGRIGLNMYGYLWHVAFIGPAGAYVWGKNFEGWTVGIQIDFLF